MARLDWNNVGKRYFESGVDQGVLYVDGAGVPWTGITSVDEAPNGGEARPYYIDGIKYLNISASEEFEATLNAFGSPPEFDPCDGVAHIQNGLYVTQQRRKAFGLSYRSMVGNDLDGPSHAYKIHLVYNALAAPSTKTNSTLSDSPEPAALSWSLTTLPPSLTGYKPTAHLVIDSRDTPDKLLSALEDMLYGTDSNTARLPEPSELMSMFRSEGPVVVRNLATNPSGRASAGTIVVRENIQRDPRTTTLSFWRATGTMSLVTDSGLPAIQLVEDASGGSLYIDSTDEFNALTHGLKVGDTVYASVDVKVTTAMPVRINMMYYNGMTGTSAPAFPAPQQPADGWVRYTSAQTITNMGTNGYLRVLVWPNVIGLTVGQGFLIRRFLVEKNVEGPYFDGTESPDSDLTPYWASTANGSYSRLRGPLPSGHSSDVSLGRISYYSASRDAVAIINRSASQWFLSVPWVREEQDLWTWLVKTELVGSGTVRVLPYFYSNSPPVGGDTYVGEAGPAELRVQYTKASGVPSSNAVLRVDPMIQGQTLYVKNAIMDRLYSGDYFDGASIDSGANYYTWDGVANASPSSLNSWN